MKIFNLLLCIILVNSVFPLKNLNAKENISYDLLHNKKWYLVEMLSTKNDTIKNTTLFLHACEKDNFYQFSNNGTYAIYEGDTKCEEDAEEQKGGGAWEIDEANKVLLDTYQGGKEIEKIIEILNETTFKISYESTGNQVFSMTYLNEEAMENEEIVQEFDDPKNYSKIIKEMTEDLLTKSGRYNVYSNTFQDATSSSPKKDILVLGFCDSHKDSANVCTVNDFSNYKDFDYIVKGDLLDAHVDSINSDERNGVITYKIQVYEPSTAQLLREDIIDYDGKKKGNIDLRRATKVGFTFFVSRGLHSGMGWNDLYSTAFAVEDAMGTADRMDGIFSDGLNRKSIYDDHIAILKAIDQSAQRLEKSLLENLPLELIINDAVEYDKRGNIKMVRIEGGENCNLKNGDQLEAVKHNTITLSDGSSTNEKILLAKLTVKQVDSKTAVCKVTRVKSGNFNMAFEKEKEKIKVVTSAKVNKFKSIISKNW